MWRRMAYFVTHFLLTLLDLSGSISSNRSHLAVVLCCLLIATLLLTLEHHMHISTDTLLGILAHTSLSLGLVMMFMEHVRVDLISYLLAITCCAVTRFTADLHRRRFSTMLSILVLERLVKCDCKPRYCHN